MVPQGGSPDTLADAQKHSNTGYCAEAAAQVDSSKEVPEVSGGSPSAEGDGKAEDPGVPSGSPAPPEESQDKFEETLKNSVQSLLQESAAPGDDMTQRYQSVNDVIEKAEKELDELEKYEQTRQVTPKKPQQQPQACAGDEAAGGTHGRFAKGDLDLQKVVDTENPHFGSRTPVGQRFTRWLAKKAQNQVDFERSMDPLQFKLNWAKGEYEHAKISRLHTEGHEEQYLKHGRLYPLARIVVEKGGRDSPEAVKDAVLLAKKCVQLGYPFVETDAFTGSLHYMYFEQHFNDIVHQKWVKKMEQRAVEDQDGEGSGGEGDGGDAGRVGEEVPAKAGRHGQATAKAKAKAKPTPRGGGEVPVKDISSSDKALNKARKVVGQAQTAQASGRSIADAIVQGGDWEWARTPQVQGILKTALADIDTLSSRQDSLAQLLFMNTDQKGVKSKLTAADIELQGEALSNTLEGKVTLLMSIVQQAMKAKTIFSGGSGNDAASASGSLPHPKRAKRS